MVSTPIFPCQKLSFLLLELGQVSACGQFALETMQQLRLARVWPQAEGKKTGDMQWGHG
jgi:hypothetical protein